MSRLRLDFTGQPIDLAEQRRKAVVSDRAIVRFMERAGSYPVENVRARILSEPVLQGLALGASRVTHDGLTFILDNGRVVSVSLAGGG